MRKDEVLKVLEYNYWANKRLLDAARPISNEQFTASAAFPFAGLRGTLVHVIDAEHSWRMLLQEGVITENTPEASFSNLEDLETRWTEEEGAMRAHLAGLHDEDLTGLIRYTISAGVRRERVIWHCLYHLVNHGTQHRAEAAAILTSLGHSPGDLDFTAFLNETA